MLGQLPERRLKALTPPDFRVLEEIKGRYQWLDGGPRIGDGQELDIHLEWIRPVGPWTLVGRPGERESDGHAAQRVLARYVEDDSIPRLHSRNAVPLFVSPATQLNTNLEVRWAGHHQPIAAAWLSKQPAEAGSHDRPPPAVGIELSDLAECVSPRTPGGLVLVANPARQLNRSRIVP